MIYSMLITFKNRISFAGINILIIYRIFKNEKHFSYALLKFILEIKTYIVALSRIFYTKNTKTQLKSTHLQQFLARTLLQ